MTKKDPILEGMKTYFQKKSPQVDMKELLKVHSSGNAKAARSRWDKENPEEKSMARLLAGERA